MKYPSILHFYNLLPLFIPDPERVKSTYELLKIKDPQTPFPFWAQIWPAAKAMTTYLEKNPHWIQNKHVLEIGAGIGLPSFSIATKAATVQISDYDAEAVLYLEKNIAYAAYSNVKAMCLNWNDIPATINAEVLLLSDVNYAPETFATLLKMIQRFLKNGTQIILSTPQRITISPFAEVLLPYIKESTVLKIDHLQQWIDIRILILSM